MPQETLEDLLETAKGDSRRGTVADEIHRVYPINGQIDVSPGGGFGDVTISERSSICSSTGAADRFGTPMGVSGSPIGSFRITSKCRIRN